MHIKTRILACACLGLTALMPRAEVLTTDPIGLNKVTCLNNSDTIVGVPLRTFGSIRTTLAAPPVVDGDSVTLTLSTGSLEPGALGNHYLKFIDGDREGRWYDIETAADNGTPNTASTVTINLNGDSIGGVTIGDMVLIAEFWTLDTLFPPAGATTGWTETPVGSGNWVQNGHAIRASLNTLGTGRRTEVLIPNYAAAGINLPPEGRYYIHNGIWKRSNSGNNNFGLMRIYPDAHIRISHPPSVDHPTVFRNQGEVEVFRASIPLSTLPDGSQDNYIALPRPIPLQLNQLNLLGTSAFMASTNTLGTGRRDEVLVFDNELKLRNKSPSARYYVHNGIWKLSNGGNTDRGTDEIPAGAGIIIRKYQSGDGATVFWDNLPTY